MERILVFALFATLAPAGVRPPGLPHGAGPFPPLPSPAPAAEAPKPSPGADRMLPRSGPGSYRKVYSWRCLTCGATGKKTYSQEEAFQEASSHANSRGFRGHAIQVTFDRE